MSTPTKPRRARERVARSDGTVVVQTKPPRADVLWYPRLRWPTVLVRRTHDVELARQLAEERWADVDDSRPLTGGMRVGWWRTYASSGGVPGDAAEDFRGRVVQACRDDAHGAGAGVEFRP